MRSFLRAVGALWRVAILEMLQYRGEIALWAIWGIVYPAVALAMWNAALDGAGQGALAGYDRSAFAAYFLASMIVGHMVTAWDAFELGWLVRTGNLSPLLLRPILPIWASMGANAAYKLITLVILIPVWFVVGLITQPALSVTLPGLLLAGVAVILAAAVNYIWGYSIALLAFWTTRTDAVAEFWFGGSLVFGGRLAPLALLPPLLGTIANLLPFKWIIWFPAEALCGRLTPLQAMTGIAFQVGWLLGGVLAFRLLWRVGLRQYSAVGA